MYSLNNRVWCKSHDNLDDWKMKSSVLFDCVAVYLCFQDNFLRMKDLPLKVDGEGYTVIVKPDDQDYKSAQVVRVAVQWKNQMSFKEYLVNVLTADKKSKL